MPVSGPDVVAEEWLTTQKDLLNELLDGDFHRDKSGLRFFRLNRSDIPRRVPMPVFWSPVPRRAVDCLGRDGARELCDWTPPETGRQPRYATLRGGREFHTEYCEYVVVLDPQGRPKRVEITTELREWWLCLARHAPEQLLQEAARTLHGAQAAAHPLRYQD